MEKSKKIYLIIIIICIIVIILMGIIIGILLKNKNKDKEFGTNRENELAVYTNNLYRSMENMDKDFEKYKDIGIDKGMEDDAIVIPNNNDYILKDVLSVEINHKGEAYINIAPNNNLYDSYGSKHKLKSDVINAGIYTVGNGDYSYIYLVNKDGTVSYVDSVKIYEENIIEVVKLENLSNIISLVQISQLDAAKVMAIDIYGNMHDLNEQ